MYIQGTTLRIKRRYEKAHLCWHQRENQSSVMVSPVVPLVPGGAPTPTPLLKWQALDWQDESHPFLEQQHAWHVPDEQRQQWALRLAGGGSPSEGDRSRFFFDFFGMDFSSSSADTSSLFSSSTWGTPRSEEEVLVDEAGRSTMSRLRPMRKGVNVAQSSSVKPCGQPIISRRCSWVTV